VNRGELLGSLEHIVLLALVQLDGRAHGALIWREIHARTGRDISISAVYATLDRLEEKGYVSSRIGEPTPERGGRAKRLFQLKAAGTRALRVSEQTLRAMTTGPGTRWGTV
jgi:PadR family transcriptional regulator PadR